jgi:hypothetical protein
VSFPFEVVDRGQPFSISVFFSQHSKFDQPLWWLVFVWGWLGFGSARGLASSAAEGKIAVDDTTEFSGALRVRIFAINLGLTLVRGSAA